MLPSLRIHIPEHHPRVVASTRLPTGASHNVPYSQKQSWRGDDWWISMQTYDARVHRLLLRRKTAGMSILWISHSERCLPLADEVYLLEKGVLALQTDRSPYPSVSNGQAATPLPDHRASAWPTHASEEARDA